jgi:hypothetical protein
MREEVLMQGSSYNPGVNRCKALEEAQQPSGVVSFLVIFPVITSFFTRPA